MNILLIGLAGGLAGALLETYGVEKNIIYFLLGAITGCAGMILD